MRVIQVSDIAGTDRDVMCPRGGFRSLRLLLAEDGMGFTICNTIVPVGPPQHWHYTRHLEACFCVTGGGILTNLETGEQFSIIPGCLYVLDEHDDHTFQATSLTVLISVFNPPLTGREVHKEDASYE
jgi:L-ectoine synthase